MSPTPVTMLPLRLLWRALSPACIGPAIATIAAAIATLGALGALG